MKDRKSAGSRTAERINRNRMIIEVIEIDDGSCAGNVTLTEQETMEYVVKYFNFTYAEVEQFVEHW